MIEYSIIQYPGALGRNGAENGIIQVNNGKDFFFVEGERIHGEESLTVDVCCPSEKDTYPTYSAAAKALRLRSANGQRTKRIYKCEECGCFHLTTTDGKSRRPRPYKREREKEFARRQTSQVACHSERVDSEGFSMRRYRNYISRLNMKMSALQ